MPSDYYYLDMDIRTMVFTSFGISDTASLDGKTEEEQVHRVFLTKGQFNKLEKALSA